MVVGLLIPSTEQNLQGQTDIASDSASCLSQVSKQTLNLMRIRNHLHAELIQAISTMLEHSLHPIHSYKVKAHSGIIRNEGADAQGRTAALTDTTDIAPPDARDPFHNIHWLSLKTSHRQTDGLHRTRALPIHYLTNVNYKCINYKCIKSTNLALLIPLARKEKKRITT
eukprot:80904-Pelagomonas_calceolata.AAC.1